MGSSTTDSPSPQPQTFVSSMTSVLTRMESGESEPPATSRSASTSHLPLRSTSISSLNSSESYPSQEQPSHFSLRSHHSHHSVRSLGGASQQLSLSALLPQPGMSPPLDEWPLTGTVR
ncbi:uncharacterized protein LOC119092206 [Pollicipes pollicipes]|uniref:uncharacterized protein LOC119092206 n=1 Tax=Pollicipes pollicipes TaxID=41117 RepID=UPI00188589F4|nr:uncharacterized protein LOC119092206 [Pollicipes pollicipes]